MAVALAVAEAAGASEPLPNLDLKEEMTSARMLWGLPFSLGGARIEALALAAVSGAAVTVVAESLICRSLRLESCKNRVWCQLSVVRKHSAEKKWQYPVAAQCRHLLRGHAGKPYDTQATDFPRQAYLIRRGNR